MVKSLDELEEESQECDAKLNIEQKKALIAQLKKKYGADWKRVFNIKSGIDWQAVKFKV